MDSYSGHVHEALGKTKEHIEGTLMQIWKSPYKFLFI